MKLFLIFVAVALQAQSFYGCGVSALPQMSPKPTGWCAAIVTASAAQKVYSISEVDWTIVRTNAALTVQTSARTGAAVYMRSFGAVNLYALADAGAATTGANSSGAGAAGGLITFPIRPGLSGTFGVRLLRSVIGGTQTLVEMGILWGKPK